jgi:LmbE family N-acetylglucosaminyl deacetylase
MSKRILVVAAHPDDEILGVGGTIARHVSGGDLCAVAILADTHSARYDDETMEVVRRCAREAAHRLGVSDVRFGGLADQRLDTVPIVEIIDWVAKVLHDVEPQVVYTHHRGDINRDHQIAYEATLTAARPYSTPFVERILCYETPSATEWAGPHVEHAFIPNVFVDIGAHLDTKLNALSAYKTELCRAPHPRSLEALRTRAGYWGSIVNLAAAEPFALSREISRTGESSR